MKGLELHFRVRAEVVSNNERPTKRLLLYKHGDDLRQELLAIQFIERCNQILLSSGLDLKLKTFSCQPVGSKTVSILLFVLYLLYVYQHSLSSSSLRASLSGFEERYHYLNFATRVALPIQDPIMARVRTRGSRKPQPTKPEQLGNPLRLMRY